VPIFNSPSRIGEKMSQKAVNLLKII